MPLSLTCGDDGTDKRTMLKSSCPGDDELGEDDVDDEDAGDESLPFDVKYISKAVSISSRDGIANEDF